jgi:hypothetical protein
MNRKNSGRDNWCKHYNGYYMKACKAGVNYKEGFPGELYDDRPCLDRDSTVQCQFKIYRTPDEIQAKALERTEALKHFVQASNLIAAQSGHAGTIQCPKCNGTLSWGRSSSNGHVHGHCENNGCLSWMQ